MTIQENLPNTEVPQKISIKTKYKRNKNIKEDKGETIIEDRSPKLKDRKEVIILSKINPLSSIPE